MRISSIVLVALVAVGSWMCGGGKKDAGKDTGPGPTGAPVFTGVIDQTMDASNYTYVRIRTPDDSVWAAAPKFGAKIGDTVTFVGDNLMKDFRSESLNRSFSSIYFAREITAPSHSCCPQGGAAPAHMDPADHRTPAPDLDYRGIAKLRDGFTVAELIGKRETLAGKKVGVRGKVVKVNRNIMGKNWLHVRDGSGTAETGDITVTTQDDAGVGQTVVVRGELKRDVDLGHGYKFPVIISDAAVTIEN